MSELKSKPIPKHRVSYSLGYTINAGNFESARIDIGLEVDGLDGETPSQTFEKAEKFVTERLKSAVLQAREDLTEGD